MEHYEDKIKWLIKFQNKICTGCGKELFPAIYSPEKVTIAHNLSKTKKNIKNYPLMIHSLLNISLQHNSCNVARRQPKFDNPEKLNILCKEYLNIGGFYADKDIYGVYKEFYCQGFTYAVAEQIEKFLQNNLGFADYVNYRGW